MLNQRLIHPPLLAALAAAGHGSQVLLADGNYPHSTGRHPDATLVHLNLRPGLVGVDDLLDLLVEALPIEAATVMVPPDGPPPGAHRSYREQLGGDVRWTEVGRQQFYDAARQRDVAVVVATGDMRHYANLLLTIGVRPDVPSTR